MVLGVLAGCGFEIGATSIDAPPVPRDGPVEGSTDDAPDAPGPAIQLVQHNSRFIDGVASVDCMFTSAQTPGHTNIVVVSWSATSSEVTSVSDSAGNTYVSTGLHVSASGFSERIYYAANITGSQAATNRVVASFPQNLPFPKVRIFEYAGLATVSPYETGVASNGNGATASSGSVTTMTPHTLLFAANVVNGVSGAVAPFVEQEASDGDLVEAYELHAPTTMTATATVSTAQNWIMLVAAFRGR